MFFHILISFSKAFLSLMILLISAILRAHFCYSSWGFFFLFCFFVGLKNNFFSTPYIGLLCFLRMRAINSCVGDT